MGLKPRTTPLGAANASADTDLHDAVQAGDAKKVKRCLAAGADPNAHDADGCGPLSYANAAIAKLLLEAGANPNQKDADGRTPVLESYSDPRKLQVLLDHGGDLDVRDRLGCTVLHYTDNAEVIRIAARRCPRLVSVIDRKGRTPLHRLGGTTLKTQADNCLALLEASADPLAKDKEGRTPLHLAAQARSSEKVTVAVAVRDSWNATDLEGKTPLHLAAQFGSETAAKALLSKGADIQAVDKKGTTPLHLAAEHTQTAMVAFLLARGANPQAKNRSGQTPLECAQADTWNLPSHLKQDQARIVKVLQMAK